MRFPPVKFLLLPEPEPFVLRYRRFGITIIPHDTKERARSCSAHDIVTNLLGKRGTYAVDCQTEQLRWVYRKQPGIGLVTNRKRYGSIGILHFFCFSRSGKSGRFLLNTSTGLRFIQNSPLFANIFTDRLSCFCALDNAW